MYFSGQNGRLDIATNGASVFSNVGRLKNWSFTTQQQTLDTTCLADVDKTIVNGIRSTTGQASLLYYEESLSNVNLVGKELIKPGQGNNPDWHGFGGTAAEPTLCLIKLSLPGGDVGTDKRTTAMYAYVTSFALTCAVSEVVTAEISWEAHGAPFIWNY